MDQSPTVLNPLSGSENCIPRASRRLGAPTWRFRFFGALERGLPAGGTNSQARHRRAALDCLWIASGLPGRAALDCLWIA